MRRKGLDVLLDALAALARRGLRPRLWVAGDGPERAALAAQAERLGVPGRSTCSASATTSAICWPPCDVFVLPSRAEGLGVAALEAMAAGRAGGGERRRRPGRGGGRRPHGLLVPPGDAVALGAALERLLPSRRCAPRSAPPGRGGSREGFLAEQMVEAYERLYRDVLAVADDRPAHGRRPVRR